MIKFKVGDILKSNMTGCGIRYGGEYKVLESKYNLKGFVVIRNDEGYVEFYDEGLFELVKEL